MNYEEWREEERRAIIRELTMLTGEGPGTPDITDEEIERLLDAAERNASSRHD